MVKMTYFRYNYIKLTLYMQKIIISSNQVGKNTKIHQKIAKNTINYPKFASTLSIKAT